MNHPKKNHPVNHQPLNHPEATTDHAPYDDAVEAIAHKLLDALRGERKRLIERKGNYVPAAPIFNMTGRYAEIQMRTRFRWRREDGKVILTGGVLLAASIPAPSFGGLRWEKEWSLKPEWNLAQYEEMVERAETAAILALRTQQYQEQVYRLVEALDADTQTDLEAALVEKGLPVTYADMTIDACEFLIDWLKEFGPAADGVMESN